MKTSRLKSKSLHAITLGLFCGSLLLATPAFAAIQTASGGNGLFLVNTDNGRVSFCVNSQNTAFPPRSTSSCTVLGTLGANPAGFTLNTVGNNLFLVTNAGGVVYHCVTAINGSTGVGIGSCQQIAVAPNL